jgi:hypothetical protein
MNLFALTLLIICAISLFIIDRKKAPIPFLAGCCFLTVAQGINIVGINLPAVRILLCVGFIRVLIRNEKISGGRNAIDNIIIMWSIWTLFASFFHEWSPGSGPKYVIGVIANTAGFYYLIRTFTQKAEDLKEVFRILCLLLFPIAVTMTLEHLIRHNVFSAFGGVPAYPQIRDGQLRAQGPFNHPILAGTVGATCLPYAISIYHKYKKSSMIGIGACLTIVIASTSSGPIMSLAFALGGLLLWKQRRQVFRIPLYFTIAYIFLSIFMSRAPYYIIARIDLTGSSTGFHRSLLIDQTIRHLNEWWLFGTDYTRHWMPNQGAISDQHTDITNQFIVYAVMGGLPCILLAVAAIWKTAIFATRQALSTNNNKEMQFLYWCITCSIFAHVGTGMSVSYFGQSAFFFWLPVAASASQYLAVRTDT